MKYIFLTFLFFYFTVGTMGQSVTEKEVPLSVHSAMDQLYPGAVVKSWQRNSYSHYEAEFDWKGHVTTAIFNANGLLQRSKKNVPASNLPVNIIKHAKDLYPGYTIINTTEVKTPDGKFFYEIELKKQNEIRSLMYTEKEEFFGEDTYENDKRTRGKKQNR